MTELVPASVVVLVLVLASAATAPGAVAASQPTVGEVTYVGDGAVPSERDALWLWQSESHEFEATVDADEEVNDAEVCLVVRGVDGTSIRELACQTTDVPANESTTVALAVRDWPSELTGDVELAVQLQSGENSSVIGEASLSATVLRKDADLDGDGLQNEREVAEGSDLSVADTDSDGLDDGLEVNTYGTSPTNDDTDGDGLLDGAEVNEYETDPTAPDSDGDGLADPQELELGTNPNEPDTDGDGLPDGAEVNTYQTDPTDPDTDDDGLNDAAEVEQHQTNPTDPDTDDDGLDDNLEVNTYGTNPRELDTDGDGLDDGAEVEQYGTDPTEVDSDGDGLSDGAEINQYGTNPTRADTDGDNLDDGAEVEQYGTDPTDPDTDGDGRSDYVEVQPDRTRSVPLWVAGVAAGFAAVAAGGVLAYRSNRVSRSTVGRVLGTGDANAGRGTGDPDGAREATRAASERASAAASSSSAVAASQPASSESAGTGARDGRTGPATDAGRGVSGSGTESVAAGDDVPPEFLPDEDRVLRILDEHEGRIKQADVVEETGWSKAKTSRVLSKMDDYGAVVKIQLGRGNLVARPDAVPPGVGPPEDDE